MRKLFIAVLCLCILCVGGFAGHRGYKIWKQTRLLRQAHEFLDKSDEASAVLCLRQALQANSKNIEASRMMARLAELTRSPQAILWRNRILELQPSLDNRLDLVRTALACNEAALAEKTLEGVEEKCRNTASYHSVAGAVALSLRRYANADAHFSEAARLEPTNVICRLNLTALRLQKNDPQARATLENLCSNPLVRCDALRQLTQEALRRTNWDRAFNYSKQLLQETNSLFNDRLFHLEILCASSNQIQGPFLETLKHESQEAPLKAYLLSKWLMNRVQPEAALFWIQTLPPATRTNWLVSMIGADCLVATKNWSSLQTNLMAQNWEESDSLRLTYCALAFKEQGVSSAAKAQWIRALKAAGSSRPLLLELLNKTTAWKWPLEQEEVLWVMARHCPADKWVVRDLSFQLYAVGRTRSLLNLYSLVLQNDPENLSLINNLASTALLLESWEKRPHELARQIYIKSPTNAFYASTYAYSLFVQQKTNEALRTFQPLKPEQLETPGIAAYYGIILSACGDADKARKYLNIASKSRLLPEEQYLISQALRQSSAGNVQ